jgi:methyl-accepting chemotaxis protein
MSKIINAILIGLLGGGCFTAGIYYATLEFEEQVNTWDSNYQIITDKVYAFEKVSDPKTIRLYVKELNKILDDVTFLGKMVEEGQTSAESLSDFFSEYDSKIDDVNIRLLELSQQLNESISKHREILTGLSEDLDETIDITDEEKKKLQEQSDYINQLNVELGQSINKVEEDVQTIKSSKYGKKIWKVKKK